MKTSELTGAKELLELAARAAGRDLSEWEWRLGSFFLSETHQRLGARWNPLADDGDALRLAVGLHLDISHNHPADETSWVCVDYLGSKGTVFVEDFNDESSRGVATRRVITRAAAEIGRQVEAIPAAKGSTQ